MTTEQQLRAVPADEIDTAPSGPPAYADVTTAGKRKAILPPWLASVQALRDHVALSAGFAWHAARFHALRSPVYLVTTTACALLGAGQLIWRWLHWWLFPVPTQVYIDAINDGHRHWHRAKSVHAETSKTRAMISLAVVCATVIAGGLAWAEVPHWALLPVAAAALLVLAKIGRQGGPLVQPARVPSAFEALTEDVIARALGALGLAGINRWFAEGRKLSLPGPVRQDGPGWRAEIDLPYGTTATQVIDRREQLASGLRRPLGAVWPEPVTAEHAGRLELWVGREDISKAKAPPWPLLKAGSVDVFRPFPFAVDVRGRKVPGHLAYHSWLMGSIPRQGKTAAVRVIACAAALDPLAELWIHELKGTGDLDPLEQVSHRFVSGIDDDSVAYAAASVAMLRREISKRSPRIKGLDPRICPEKRVTREIAAQKALRLRPVVCIIDEAQNLFTHEKYAKQAAEDAEFCIKIGPAMGVILVLATQRPDSKSLPKAISSNVSTRFCLKVMGQVENDMILGTSAYKNGIRATTFRPRVDAGLGFLIGEDPAQVCRTYFLDVTDAKTVAARARVARERAGTLSGVALGEDGGEPAREPLSDALAVFGDDEPGLHWSALADRLATRWPDRWGEVTADSISAQLRDYGVRSVTPSMGGQKARGARKSDIEAAISGGVPRRSEG